MKFEYVHRFNEALAVKLTRMFGNMWTCYAFMLYGLAPLLRILQPHREAFLYWSNWIQLWSLPLILVGTNILSRDAERRAKQDHEILAKSYEKQNKLDEQVIATLATLEKMMGDLRRQDRVLEKQDEVLAEQTSLLREQVAHLEELPAVVAGERSQK
jgi:hypothetical protein